MSTSCSAPPATEPTETPSSTTAPAPKPDQPAALLLNSIVKRCCNAYDQALAAENLKAAVAPEGSRLKISIELGAKDKAREAYLAAMPLLTAPIAIRAFIACVAHAMMRDIISAEKGTKLLYAAQMARSGLAQPSRPVGRPKKEGTLPEK